MLENEFKLAAICLSMTSSAALIARPTSGSQNVRAATENKPTSLRVDRRLKFTSPHTHFSSQSAFELHSDQTYKLSVAEPRLLNYLFINKCHRCLQSEAKTLIAMALSRLSILKLAELVSCRWFLLTGRGKLWLLLNNQKTRLKLIFKNYFAAAMT